MSGTPDGHPRAARLGTGAAWFGAGIVVGFFLFYTLAWRTGALAEGHWLTRRTAEVPGRSVAPVTSPAVHPSPVLTPVPTPGPTPGA